MFGMACEEKWLKHLWEGVSSGGDVNHYVIIWKLLESIFKLQLEQKLLYVDFV